MISYHESLAALSGHHTSQFGSVDMIVTAVKLVEEMGEYIDAAEADEIWDELGDVLVTLAILAHRSGGEPSRAFADTISGSRGERSFLSHSYNSAGSLLSELGKIARLAIRKYEGRESSTWQVDLALSIQNALFLLSQHQGCWEISDLGKAFEAGSARFLDREWDVRRVPEATCTRDGDESSETP